MKMNKKIKAERNMLKYKSEEDKRIEKIADKIVPLLKKYGVTRAGIFGSYARGDMKKKSDIDILVEIREEMSLLDIIGLKLELEKILKKKVDLVEYSAIKSRIKKQILNEEVRII
jgi:hypothetical protein